MTSQTDAVEEESTILNVAPALDLVLDASQTPQSRPLVDGRVLWICALSIVLGAAMAVVAQLLIRLIDLVTNLSFHLQWSLAPASPLGHGLGWFVVLVPAAGGLLVGILARFGSQAIRGHGIPEAMEQVLTNESRIPARLTFLKPLSSAIAIGTGGPFGAEGPIISTGGAFGSLLGQLIHSTAAERKTLLAAGAAAGMSATFGSPVSAVVLAVELLLFEYRARSLIPVALASAAAAGLRIAFEGHGPVFPMPNVQDASLTALAFYVLLGAVVGVCAAGATRLVYWLEERFEQLSIHWMWWPALGGLAVGLIGYFFPATLGVGYGNIAAALSGRFMLSGALLLAMMKFCSWWIALSSGTSGGTLAPLLTMGSCLGAAVAMVVDAAFPALGIDVRVGALVGMAAMFAGASRALLASVIFAFETTLQPLGLLPLLGGCSASYLASCFLMRHTIMTERIARRGMPVSGEYEVDLLNHILVRSAASRPAVTLREDQTLDDVRQWIASGAQGSSHQGFPVLDRRGCLVGVVMRREILSAEQDPAQTVQTCIRQPPRFVYDDCSLRAATEHMVNHDLGRLPVVFRGSPGKLIGILTRSDILASYRQAIREHQLAAPSLEVRLPVRLSRSARKPAQREEHVGG